MRDAHAMKLNPEDESGIISVRDLRESEVREGRAAGDSSNNDHLAALGRITASVAHEINNPLAYVSGNLELLEELTKGAAELHSLVQETRQGVDRIRAIVKDLKTVSKRDDPSTHETSRLHTVLADCMKVAAPHFRHRGELTWSFLSTPYVAGSAAALGKIFLNILINAAEAFSAEQKEGGSVHVTTERDGELVLTAITDDGPGIDAGTLERIFDPFFTTKDSGTGIGLSVVKETVENLGGRIEVKSAPDQGTQFRVWLPARDRGAVKAPPSAPRAPARRRTVVLIDDELGVRKLVSRALGRDHDVLTFDNPTKALPWFAEGHDVDIVLCDLMMPLMTGVEFHAELARIRPSALCLITFLTGGACTPATRAFLSHPGTRFLEKPFSIEVLRNLVEAAGQ